jgi:PAS domain S-box-containing protein
VVTTPTAPCIERAPRRHRPLDDLRRAVEHDEIEVDQLPIAALDLWRDVPSISSDARLIESVFEASPIGMSLVDASGTHLAVNPAFARLLDTDVASVATRSCWDDVHPDDRARDEAATAAVLLGEMPSYVLEERLVSRAGSIRWVEVTVSGVADHEAHGDPPRLLRQVRSTAAGRALADAHRALEARAAELAAANERLASFADTLTHDLLQPLSALAGFLALLQRTSGSMGADQRDWIDRAVRGKDHLVSAIGALRAHAVDARVALAPVDVGRLVADQLTILEAELRGAEVTVDAPLPIVQADAGMLAQAVGNLLRNAVRYQHPDRALRLHVGAVAAGTTSVLHVRDNGRGLTAGDVESIFEPGMRGSAGAAAQSAGTGTGLATVRSLVARMGGRAWAEPSGDGSEGAAFFLELQRSPARG